MLREVIGNLVTDGYKVFCQQVNCKGVMGAGLAKQIRSQYPEVYNKYRTLCNQGDAKLGTVQAIRTTDDRICINMFAQYSYGRDGKYTSYDAFDACLEKLANYLERFDVTENMTVGFPMYIGCGLAGGDWRVIYNKLKEFSEKIPYDVVLVRLKKEND